LNVVVETSISSIRTDFALPARKYDWRTSSSEVAKEPETCATRSAVWILTVAKSSLETSAVLTALLRRRLLRQR
jgi:hypothetical protein